MVAMERDARNLDVEWEQVQIQWRAKYGAGVPPPQDPLLQLPDSDDEGEPINMKAAMDRAGESAPGSVLGGGDNGSQAGGDGGSDAVEQQRTMRRADRKPKKKKKKKWLKPWRWLKRRWLLLRHSVDLRGFALLRRVCQLRFAAHSMDSNVRTFSYINVASQVLEADLEQVRGACHPPWLAQLSHLLGRRNPTTVATPHRPFWRPGGRRARRCTRTPGS